MKLHSLWAKGGFPRSVLMKVNFGRLQAEYSKEHHHQDGDGGQGDMKNVPLQEENSLQKVTANVWKNGTSSDEGSHKSWKSNVNKP